MKNRNKLNKLKSNYSKIPNKLYKSNLSSTAIALYTYLASNAEEFNPSIRVIAKALKISNGTVVKYLTELKNRNIIKVIKPGGEKVITEYAFCGLEEWRDI